MNEDVQLSKVGTVQAGLTSSKKRNKKRRPLKVLVKGTHPITFIRYLRIHDPRASKSSCTNTKSLQTHKNLPIGLVCFFFKYITSLKNKKINKKDFFRGPVGLGLLAPSVAVA